MSPSAIPAPGPAPQPHPAGRRSRLAEWPFAVVLLTALAGLAVIALLDRFRRGSVLFGGSLVLASIFRLVLPTRAAGLLAVRSRPFDVVTYVGLGVGIALLAVVTPADTAA